MRREDIVHLAWEYHRRSKESFEDAFQGNRNRLHDEGRKITCAAKCAHCCYRIISGRVYTGVLIYDRFKHDYLMLRSAYHQGAEHMSFLLNELDSAQREWAQRKIPCVFLRGDMCLVHDIRPPECAAELVTTPEYICDMKAYPSHIIDRVDMKFFTRGAQFLDAEFLHEVIPSHPRDKPVAGTLGLLVEFGGLLQEYPSRFDGMTDELTVDSILENAEQKYGPMR